MPEYYNLFSAISNLVSSSVPGDFVDSLNFKATPLIFLNLATLLAIKQFIFKPIQCWVPAEYTSAWEEYVENYCWVQNTYYVPQNASVPEDTNRRLDGQINYYQWVPFILIMQAILFALPYLLWNALCTVTGINVHMILKMSTECCINNMKSREKFGEALALHFERSILLHQPSVEDGPRKTTCGVYVKPFFIVGLYSFTKMLTLLNVFCQFFLLDALLGTGDLLYGLRVLINLSTGHDWQASGLFPRVTLCDFYKRVIANIHLQTVQCVLPANMLHEKVFLLVWWWLVFMALVNTIAGALYIFDMLPSRAYDFVYSLLNQHIYGARIKRHQLLYIFCTDHIGRDGLLLLRFIYINNGAVVASDLVTTLWNNYQREYNKYYSHRNDKRTIESLLHGQPYSRTLNQPKGALGPLNEIQV